MSVGYDGYSYSSTVSNTLGIVLYFYTQRLRPSYASYRAHGLQLRCLSE
ncbi:hypothetical protein [uncultured Rikenella sp.]|nr:hypothetical protein [uncultured Rikenella sp.]